MQSTNLEPFNVRQRIQDLRFRTALFINGEFVEALSEKTFNSINPSNGEVLAQISAADEVDVDRAVISARQAFESGHWRTQSPQNRKSVLMSLALLIETHSEELALLESLEVGKPLRDALNIDLPATVNTFRWYAEALDKLYGEVASTPYNSLAYITREPIGVVGVVVPWNFPLYMASWKLAPALALGNSVILKPSERSSLSALRLAELAIEAGLPPGVLNVVPGYGNVAGQALGRHSDVDAIAFTGSTETGKRFLIYSGESNMKSVSLETGGKTPHIVYADTPDLKRVAVAAAWGIFFNQGEVCNAGSRLLVQRDIKDKFLEHLTEVTEKIRLGDPISWDTQMGAIVDARQLERIKSAVTNGLEEGASLLMGGQQVLQDSGGYFFEPTIFTDANNSMSIARKEIFGPVLTVIAFDTLKEAIDIANDSIYGLAAAIWTSDLSNALTSARDLRAGQVWVNNFDGSDITVPWGGYKQSGIGRDKSLHAFNKYSELKATWIEIN